MRMHREKINRLNRGRPPMLPLVGWAAPPALAVVVALGAPAYAQTIRIKLLNGRNGRPLAHSCINLWVGHGRVAASAVVTNKKGVASLRLTTRAAEINTAHWPLACTKGLEGRVPIFKYASSVKINVGYVVCVPHGSNYSWLALMKFSTKKILQSGIVTPNSCGKARASPKPGEITLFVRPLTLWEKLKE